MTNSGRRLSSVVSALLCCALFGAACARQDTTTVARGEYYAAGHPDYDEFFVSLYRFQVDTAEALKEEQNARAELARGLGSKTDKPKELSPLIKQRAEQLAQEGVTVVVRLGPNPTVDISGEPSEEQQKFLMALRVSTAKLAGVVASTSSNEEVDRLRTRLPTLEQGTDSTFQAEGSGKQTEVKNNLTDAQKLLVLISDSRKQLAQSSSELLRDIEQTFAAPLPPPPPVVEEQKPKPKKRAVRAKPAAAPKQASAPAPAPKPAPPKPAPKADFEP